MEERTISNNLSEDVVDVYLDGYVNSSGVCTCKQCRADIKAITLNNLPPRYVVTTTGDAFVRVSAMSVQSQADIMAAAMKAIEIVKSCPRHTEDDLKG